MSVIKGYPATNSSPTDAQVITATKDTNSFKAALDVRLLGNFIPRDFDYVSLGYTGSNLTLVTYKVGGSSGTTVATLTLAYTGSNLTSVTRALP